MHGHDTMWFLNTRVNVRVSSQDGSDGVAVLEHWVPWGDSPPLHVHRDEDEIFHILSGEFRFKMGDRERRAVAGETVLAPKNVPHTYRAESQEGARMLTITHGAFERFVRAFSRPAENDGLPDPSGPPTPQEAEALARACREYGIELVGPPLQEA